QVQVEAARANILMDLGRESDAKALIQQVLAQDPKNVEVRETLGIEALHKGERDDAQKWLGESVALGAQGFEVNMMYAELLMSSPDSDEAQIESCLRAAIRANPRDARIHDLLAHREAMDHSRLADALQQSEQAVALDPGNVAYRETAAFEQEQMGKLGDAEKTLQAALAVAHTPEEKQSLQERLDDLQHMPQVVGPPTPTAVQSSAKGAIDIPAADANGPDQGLVNQGIGNQGITDQDSDDQRPRIARARAGSSGANGPVDIPPQPSATGVVTQPSDTPKHPDAANGPKHSAEGVMRLVHCSYPMEIEFELVGRKKTVQVYNNHFNQLQMSAVGFSPQGSMNPCRDFEGMKARIQYAESTDKTVDGKVLSIVLMK
ncbi:MAG TPA: tetratricopeptide repeat protein, partial [Terracidiphilus sp.]|nr:tetratricopeptide repeat protein [Terracidiphilus sp.]